MSTNTETKTVDGLKKSAYSLFNGLLVLNKVYLTNSGAVADWTLSHYKVKYTNSHSFGRIEEVYDDLTLEQAEQKYNELYEQYFKR